MSSSWKCSPSVEFADGVLGSLSCVVMVILEQFCHDVWTPQSNIEFGQGTQSSCAFTVHVHRASVQFSHNFFAGNPDKIKLFSADSAGSLMQD